MSLRAYRCRQCGYADEVEQPLSAPVLTVCPACGGPSLQRHHTAAGLPTFRISGPHYVNGERRFRRPFVGRERDGSETVYTSEVQALRSEYERVQQNTALTKGGHVRLAQKNVQHMRKHAGLRPGTKAAQIAQAIEDKPRIQWRPD